MSKFRLLAGGCFVSALALASAVMTGCNRQMSNPAESEATTESLAAGAPAAGVPLVIGTYTGDVENGQIAASQGLYTMTFDGSEFGSPELVVPVENPSFVVVDDENHRVYAVSETETGQLLAFNWDEQGRFTLINTVPTLGAYPCYLALSPGGTHLAVANYGTGNVAVYEIDPQSGALVGPAQKRRHEGAGPNQQRQEGPHAHWVQWNPAGDYLYVVDLGIDKVMGYPFNSETGELGEGFTAIETAPGSGPRHLAFHPYQDFAYIVTELDNKVVVAQHLEDGRMQALQTVSTLPDDFKEHSQAAHIAISADGQHLYTSNRGHNSIAVFDVAEDGRVELVQLAGTQGDWPRAFALLPAYDTLLVANQNSHNLVPFSVGQDGRLSPDGEQVQIAKPVYIAPLNAG